MAELTVESVLQLFEASDKRMEKMTQELKAQFAETDIRMEKLNHEMRLQFAATEMRMEKSSRALDKKIASLGDTLGRFAEEQVRADVINKFTKWGIQVHFITDHFEMQNDIGEFLYEIDILVSNEKYVVAIEVKNNLKKEGVDEHLERIEKIRAYPIPFAKGKTLLAGVAGMIVGNGVDKYAEKNGLFVLKPSGDTVKIVNDEKTFRPREWVL